MNAQRIVKTLKRGFIRELPTILSASSVILSGVAIGLAIKATPEAHAIVQELKQDGEPTKRDIVKSTWKCYIPASVCFLASSACTISSNTVNLKRNAALSAVCTATNVAYNEYREKVKSTLGQQAEQKVRDSIYKDKIDANPVDEENIFDCGGDILCYDAWCGRYFKADQDVIRRALNEVNRQINTSGYSTLNEFYYNVGLPEVKGGEKHGWEYNVPKVIDPVFSSQITDKGRPCLVVDFNVDPMPLH